MKAERATHVLVLLVVGLHAAILFAQSSASEPASLIGTWRGTSLCTDRVAAPACHDEDVVYEFTPGLKPGTVRWAADKVVNGKREPMGELDLSYDKAEGCWKREVNARVKSVWRLSVEGTHLTGTARLLPGNETIRKLDLRKENDDPIAVGNVMPGLKTRPATA
jgi:hypothetical protein